MVLLRDIIGHDEIIKTLKGALASGRVAHAYLFSGPRGVGKHTVATAFARALVCGRQAGGDGCGQCGDCLRVAGGTHPDVRVTGPTGASVKIGQVREIISGVQFGPAEGRWTVRIVDEADTMTTEAANALLKTLEEPLPGVVFILVTARPQALLPTIISRCQHLYFQPLLERQLIQGLEGAAGSMVEDVKLAASLAGGSLGRALDLLAGGIALRERAWSLILGLSGAGVEEAMALAAAAAERKEEAAPLLEMMVLWFRDILVYNESGSPGSLINADKKRDIASLAGYYSTGRLLEMIGDTDRAKESLAASANVQLALEALFLSLAGYCPDVARWEEVVWN